MTKLRTVALLSFALALVTPAASLRAAGVQQRPIELADIMAWRFINASAVSDDGVWFGYHIGPTEGDGEVVFRQTRTEKAYRFPAGEAGFHRPASPVFSRDAKFAAFTIYPTSTEAAVARPQRCALQNSVAVVNLDTGAKIEAPKVRRFALAPSGGWIALHKYAPDATPTASATDLLLRELATGQQIFIGNVSDFAFDKQGRYLVWTVDTQDKVGNGMQLRDMRSGAVHSLESDDRAVYSRMSWSDDGEGLALLKGLEDRTPGSTRYFVVGFTAFGSGAPQKTVFNPATADGFPSGFIVSPNRNPTWTDDRSALLFGVQKPSVTTARRAAPAQTQARTRTPGADPRTPAAAAGADDTSAEEKVDLVLWHWQDKRLQSQQQIQETLDRNLNYLALYRVADRKFILLADERVPDVTPAPGGRFAIGRDDDPYELMANLDGRRFRDLYVIDMATGARTLAVSKSPWSYGASPTGTHFLYYDDGHFYSYDMRSGQSVNLTRNVPTSFIDADNNHPVEKPPTLFMGWSTDGKFALISGGWDIWQVAVDGGGGANLTRVGRTEQVRHRRPLDFSNDEIGFDLTKPLYIDLYGEWTERAASAALSRASPVSNGCNFAMRRTECRRCSRRRMRMCIFSRARPTRIRRTST
jgi:hypothetical protein